MGQRQSDWIIEILGLDGFMLWKPEPVTCNLYHLIKLKAKPKERGIPILIENSLLNPFYSTRCRIVYIMGFFQGTEYLLHSI